MADVLVHRGVDPGRAVADLATTLVATLRDYPLSLELIRHHFAAN